MSTGGGNIPPSGAPGSHIPGVTSPHQPPPPPGKGGITPHTASNALPGGQSAAPDIPIGQRNTIPTTATPQVNSAKVFENQFHQVLSFQAQYDFLNFIPNLEQRLQDPSQFKDDLPFEIVYVKDGKTTSILPPDPEMPVESEEAGKLRTALREKLSVINQKNGPEERQALREQIESARAELGQLSKAIQEAGGTVPTPPVPQITLVIDENQFTARTPARKFNPNETPRKQGNEGQFLLIPKTPSKRMPPPVTKRPANPLQEEGSKPTEIPSQPHPSAPGHLKPIETQLPVNNKGQFSDVYLLKDSEAEFGKTGNIASVNAGSTDLTFGKQAAGINAQFGAFFTDPQQAAIAQAQSDFLTDSAEQGYLGFVTADDKFTDNTPLETIYGHVSGEPDNQGTVLVSVFREGHCPAGIKKNRAMVYVIPPDGKSDRYDDKDEFLKDIKLTAKNLLATQNKYNQHAVERGLPTLPVVRTCAFGGGIYCHPDSDQEEVAQAIRAGIKDYFDAINPEENTIKEVQYEHGV
ncbi:hypothetical protein [Endozoicomonas numazuensis]|nr:hypothetical protein [Endozoicomonas numazuensis]